MLPEATTPDAVIAGLPALREALAEVTREQSRRRPPDVDPHFDAVKVERALAFFMPVDEHMRELYTWCAAPPGLELLAEYREASRLASRTVSGRAASREAAKRRDELGIALINEFATARRQIAAVQTQWRSEQLFEQAARDSADLMPTFAAPPQLGRARPVGRW